MTTRRTLLTTAALGGAAVAGGSTTPSWATAPAPADDWYAPLSKAISGLPDGSPGTPPTATAAQLRISTPAGRWQGRSGVADLETGAPVPDRAVFRIGSVTKVFTATVVLQLAGEGRLQLDAPLHRYLPGLLGAPYAEVTARHLLDHRTGLPSPSFPDGVEWQIAHRFDRHSAGELVRLALRQDREFAPGTAQRYTNMGYIVAGLLIRRLTGRSYADQIRRRIVRPLGLRDTVLPGDDPAIHGPHARGYQVIGDRLVDVTRWSQTATPGSGDMISSLRDLDVFLRALLHGSLLAPAQRRELFAVPGVPGATYSAGLQQLATRPDGRVVWGKSGARYGYSTAVAADADAGTRLVYSVNATDAKAEADKQAPVIGRIIGAALKLF